MSSVEEEKNESERESLEFFENYFVCERNKKSFSFIATPRAGTENENKKNISN